MRCSEHIYRTVSGVRCSSPARVNRRLAWHDACAWVLWALLAAAFPDIAHAEFVESHSLPTTTLTDHEFLAGVKGGKPVTISGELRIPREGSDRLPAVVLIHGSGGVGARESTWAGHLATLGIATFTLNSFAARGISGISENQSQLGRLAMIVDSYRALELLASHPRIDASRIAVMGFSRGGQASLYASLKRFRRLQGPSSVEFAAYLSFYPTCGTRFIDDTDVSDKPIRLFHGAADDYNPVASCRPYVERLRTAGKDVRLFEYAGAHHVFDNPQAGFPRYFPQPQSVRDCPLQEAADGQIINVKTKKPFTYSDWCVERGVTMGYDAGAHARAMVDVTEFLRATFGLQ